MELGTSKRIKKNTLKITVEAKVEHKSLARLEREAKPSFCAELKLSELSP